MEFRAHLSGWCLEHGEWDEVEVCVEDEHDLAGVPLGQVVLQRLQQQPVQLLQAGRALPVVPPGPVKN